MSVSSILIDARYLEKDSLGVSFHQLDLVCKFVILYRSSTFISTLMISNWIPKMVIRGSHGLGRTHGLTKMGFFS